MCAQAANPATPKLRARANGRGGVGANPLASADGNLGAAVEMSKGDAQSADKGSSMTRGTAGVSREKEIAGADSHSRESQVCYSYIGFMSWGPF